MGHWRSSEPQAGLPSPYILHKVYIILDWLVLCTGRLDRSPQDGIKRGIPPALSTSVVLTSPIQFAAQRSCKSPPPPPGTQTSRGRPSSCPSSVVETRFERLKPLRTIASSRHEHRQHELAPVLFRSSPLDRLELLTDFHGNIWIETSFFPLLSQGVSIMFMATPPREQIGGPLRLRADMSSSWHWQDLSDR